MKIENTRERFSKRISFEREILSIINNSAIESEPLYGLSRDAILHWTKNAAIVNKDIVVGKLEVISKKLQIFCDNSKNTFDCEKNVNASEIDCLISELKITLAFR